MRIVKAGKNDYRVKGLTDIYSVYLMPKGWSCSCKDWEINISRTIQYECKHIKAIKKFEKKEAEKFMETNNVYAIAEKVGVNIIEIDGIVHLSLKKSRDANEKRCKK